MRARRRGEGRRADRRGRRLRPRGAAARGRRAPRTRSSPGWSLDHHVPVVIIAGNHDGPDRLAFGSRILPPERGLHVLGTPTATPARPIQLHRSPRRGGGVSRRRSPTPPTYRACLAHRDDLHDHDTASSLSRLASRSRAPQLNPLARSVLVGHAFVRGGAESESERPLSVGGARPPWRGASSRASRTWRSATSTARSWRSARTLDRVLGLAPQVLVLEEATPLKSVSVVEIDPRAPFWPRQGGAHLWRSRRAATSAPSRDTSRTCSRGSHRRRGR